METTWPINWPSDIALFSASIRVNKHYSKKNSKVVSYRKGKPFIRTDNRAKSAEDSLVLQLQNRARALSIDKPIDIPVSLLCCIMLDNYLTKKGQVNKRAGDLTNLLQGIEDSLQKAGIIQDDALITEVTALKRQGPNSILLLLIPDKNGE